MVTLASRAQAQYREHLHEPVTIRRITGSGSTRTDESYATVGRVYRGDQKELVGGIAQQNLIAIIYAQALFDAGLPSVVIGDYLIDQDGLQYTVVEVKPRRVEAVMVAYELTVRA
jgi:hypothetical protein